VKRFDGGKNGDGVYQRIINHMPPHRVYVELFLGSAAIMRRKRPAEKNIGVEIDPVVLSAVRPELSMVDATLTQIGALEFLKVFATLGASPDVLIYADPPYLLSTRSQKGDLYRREFHSPLEHARLLLALDALPCMVIISGYASSLYERFLKAPKWRTDHFSAMSRGGPREEWLWMNFPDPIALHDYAFLGRDFTDRQRIDRKVKRFASKLAKLPPLERAAVVSTIDQSNSPRGNSVSSMPPVAQSDLTFRSGNNFDTRAKTMRSIP
jgi:hypothetical protein